MLPGKIASIPHPPHQQRVPIFRFRHSRRILPRRPGVDRTRRFQPQRFVRPLIVVLSPKAIKGPLLRAPIRRRRAQPFPASTCDACARAVHFVPDVRPRCAPARSPASSTTPPAATARLSPRGKRRAVIGANRLGSPHSRNADSKIARTRA